MTFQKILCATDFSAGSKQAIRTAARIANERDAELVVAHAWHIPPLMYPGDPIFPPVVIDQFAADAQRGLDEAMQLATSAGAKRVTSKLLTGLPWAELSELLDKQQFDLCVMGTHGRTGLSRVLLGSVTEKVVRHAPCSVLVVRPDSEPAPFKHVLCPTDFTASAARALDVAAELATPGGAGITLLHVIEAPVAYAGELSITDFARDLDRRATEAVDRETARISERATVPIAKQIRVGYPGAQTLAALEAAPTIDLVVMGSHGRTGIARALLGSVAEKVVRHAKCPVLVVRDRSLN
jgi:nucleotide-binding universal stress UspA family protein